MGPWTSQTVAVVDGEAHGDQHGVEPPGDLHRDEDLDEVLQNLRIPIQGDPPPIQSPPR
jgi:hypothetical protein